MVTIADRLAHGKLESRMIMQVHDELVFEGPESEMSDLEILVRKAMESALPGYRLPADIGIGDDWASAKA
jgi:DNA polymerase-1